MPAEPVSVIGPPQMLMPLTLRSAPVLLTPVPLSVIGSATRRVLTVPVIESGRLSICSSRAAPKLTVVPLLELPRACESRMLSMPAPTVVVLL